MPKKTSIKEAVTHPATVASALVALLGGVAKFPLLAAVWAWLMGHVGALFTGFSVLAYAGREFGVVPSWITLGVTGLAAFTGLLYGGKKLWSAVSDLDNIT